MEFPRFCLINPQDFHHPFYNSHYCRMWNQETSIKDAGATINNKKDQFEIIIDVKDYLPDDISVKVTDKEIIVEGKHEERQDSYGYVERQFKRRYALPSDCTADTVSSSLSSDGILTVVADKKSIKTTVKLVPIRLCGFKTEQIEKKTMSGITQKDIDDTIKEAKDLVNRNIVKEDHSRLLKSNILGEVTAVKNGADKIKETEEIKIKSSNGHEATSKNVGEALNTSKVRSEMAEQFGHTSAASGSTISSKSVAQESYRETMSSSQSMSMTMKTSDKNHVLSDILSSEIAGKVGNTKC